MVLTSIDYAKLIQNAAYKFCGVTLGKTQINKILFYVYGLCYAHSGKPLFVDDSPQAWVYGPVFPRVYKKVKIGETYTFSDEEKEAFMTDRYAFDALCNATRRMAVVNAVSLMEWSHEIGSPWYDALYLSADGSGYDNKRRAWGTPIPLSSIETFFKKEENLRYGK